MAIADKSIACTTGQVRRGWAVHIFTTIGAIVGMLALEAVFDKRATAAILYLLLTQLIDGVDGPMARQIDISRVVPKIDGYVLDLVIDYFTCVVVPAAMLHEFDLVPKSLSFGMAGAIVFFSAIWFSRTDMMTSENWFNGFPATWNLVVPSMLVVSKATDAGISHMAQWVNAAIVVLLCIVMLSNAKFPHPVRSRDLRPVTLFVTTAWLISLVVAAKQFPHQSLVYTFPTLIGAAYFAGLSVWKSRQKTN